MSGAGTNYGGFDPSHGWGRAKRDPDWYQHDGARVLKNGRGNVIELTPQGWRSKPIDARARPRARESEAAQ
jgi:hypothetical protein